MPTTTRSSRLGARVPAGARRALLVRVAGVALAAMLALVAVVDPVLGVAGVLMLLLAAGFTQSATFGVCAFAWFTYFEVVTAYTGSALLSPIKVTGGALIITALLHLVTRGRSKEAPRPTWSGHPVLLLSMVSFVLVGIVSASWAVNTDQVRTLSERLVTDVLVFLAIGVFLVRRGQFLALSLTVLAAGACSTLAGMVLGAETFGRALGGFLDPNEFAAALVVSLGLGFGALGVVRSTPGRVACVAALATCAYGLLASQSRGGLVALGVALLVIVLTARGRERVRMMGATLVAVAGVSAVLALTPVGQQALARITNGDSSGRSDLWRIAVLQFQDHPVRGVGLGNYPAVASRYVTIDTEHTELINHRAPRTTHNAYLEVLAELGLVGLTAFLAFCGGSLLCAARAVRVARRLGDRVMVRMGRGLLAATSGMLASSIFLSGQYAELLWALLAACVSIHAVVARRARALRQEAAATEEAAREQLQLELALPPLHEGAQGQPEPAPLLTRYP